jgi:hypothetical protein
MLKVVKSSGFAKELLDFQGHLRPYSTWMGIGTNGKTYPDEMVCRYIEWGAEYSGDFTLVIADDLQIYNQIPFNGHQGLEELRERFRSVGRQRKAALEGWARKNKIKNVKIWRWQEAFEALKTEFPSVGFDSFEQYFISGEKISDPGFHSRFIGIVETQVPGFCKKLLMEGRDEKSGKFTASLYARQEVFLTFILTLTKKASIKIGHTGEEIYDNFTSEIIGGLYGERLAIDGKDNFFGGVYLG